MVDDTRRRVLKLGGLAALSLAGAGAVLADRLRGGPGSRPPRAGAGAGARRDPPTTPSTEPATTSSSPATLDDSTSTTTSRALPEGPAAATAMLCRAAWGAAEPTRDPGPHAIAGLMVHHTAVALTDNRKAPDRVRGHQRFHQSKGFADIAYHVVVDRNGNVYEGRDPSRPGETFTNYDPTGWFLVVCEGNFDEQDFPPAQRDAVVRVLASAATRYGVGADTLASHRDHASTSCPGASIHALVADGTLARMVGEQMARGSVLETSCGPDADARVAAIEAGEA